VSFFFLCFFRSSSGRQVLFDFVRSLVAAFSPRAWTAHSNRKQTNKRFVLVITFAVLAVFVLSSHFFCLLQTRRVLYSAMLTAAPRLMEPVFRVEIQCPQVCCSAVAQVAQRE
jgi:hypothetical protein